MLLIIRTFIVVAVAWVATAVATYELAMWVHPARTGDGRHPVMPIAQAALAALVATLVALVIVGLTIRKARRRLTAPPA
jgi:hypothetical protein